VSASTHALESAFRGARDAGVLRLDAEGACVIASDAACRILGAARDALLGRGWLEGFGAEARERIRRAWPELLAGVPFRDELLARRRGGDEVRVQTDWTPDPDAEGRVRGVLVTLLDVSAQQRAEADSREAREGALQQLHELESVYHSSPVGLCCFDRELRYRWVNEVLARINGLPVAEHLGRGIFDVIPGVADAVLPLLEQVIATGQTLRDLEVRLPPPSDPDNEHVYLVTYDPVKALDGTVLGVVGAVSDVTTLKRAEEDAQARLAELETVYRHSPVGLALMDRELRYVRVNDLLARMNGHPVEHHLGRRIDEIIPDLADQVLPVYRRVIETGEPIVGREVRGPDPAAPQRDGAWILSHHPVRSAEGLVSGVITVVQDITMLRRHQTEIEEMRARLAEAQRMAGIGSWEWDILDDKVWWSEELYDLFGKDPRSFTPDYASFFDLVHDEDRPRVRAQLDATLERDEPYEVQFRVVRDDGSLRILRCNARLERSEGGLPARLVGTCLDVTALVDGGGSGALRGRR
jgi:PAS domain S-box-containing protein